MFRKFIASQFKRPSGVIGILTANMMIKSNLKNYDRLIRDFDLQPRNKILEIGYGPGIGIRKLAEMCTTCTIHGIDFSRLMYKRAGRYNKEFIDAGKVQLQYGDFLKIPVSDNDYDKIFCLNVVYFWNELSSPFQKVFSMLNQGGSFHMYMAGRCFLKQRKAPDSVFN
jgi:ubiquinone/menaquinone biosynthesis C-methylase UbiE